MPLPCPSSRQALPSNKRVPTFSNYKRVNYVVIIDRYSNLPVIERPQDGAKDLIDCLRRTFVTFGIPEELATGLEFTAASKEQFLQNWGVHHRLSSVAYPYSNYRAGVGVKTVKRIITNNTSPNGGLDTDGLQRAILQYRNTPVPDTKHSPAQCIIWTTDQRFYSYSTLSVQTPPYLHGETPCLLVKKYYVTGTCELLKDGRNTQGDSHN